MDSIQLEEQYVANEHLDDTGVSLGRYSLMAAAADQGPLEER